MTKQATKASADNFDNFRPRQPFMVQALIYIL